MAASWNEPLILHVKDVYLPFSETFIYGYLKKISKFRTVVAVQKIINEELFPFKDIHIFSSFEVEPNSVRIKRFILKNIVHKNIEEEITLEKICRRLRPALIHAHFGPLGFFSLKTAIKLRLPLITSFYGYDASALLQDNEWLQKYQELFKFASRIIVLSNDMREKLIKSGCRPKKSVVLRVGVDVEKFLYSEKKMPSSPDPLQILTVARFVEKKGYQYAVEALKQVESTFPNFEWLIVGDGPLMDETKMRVESSGLSSKVKFLGPQPHSKFVELTQSCHIFLLPSVTAENGDQEGTPTVLMEAQAAGMPVLSTIHSGIPEVVLNGISGILVLERDAQALAEGLLDLIGRAEEWKKMGKAGREHIMTHFDIETQAKQLEEIYGEVV